MQAANEALWIIDTSRLSWLVLTDYRSISD